MRPSHPCPRGTDNLKGMNRMVCSQQTAWPAPKETSVSALTPNWLTKRVMKQDPAEERLPQLQRVKRFSPCKGPDWKLRPRSLQQQL